MKFVVATLALLCICSGFKLCASNELRNRIKEVSDNCRDQEQTPQEIIEKIRAGDYDEGDVERLAMCHIKCVMEGFGAWDNGRLSEKIFVQKLESHTGKEKARELFNFCKDQTGADECEKTFKTFVCLRKLNDIFKY